MARKKSASRKPAPGNKRYRRSDDEMIADLKERIKELKNRADSRELKKSAAYKASHSAVKYIDKALEAAAEEGQSALRHALADARKPIAAHLEAQGIKLPKANLPRGRRPKDD
jgi:hypothetical protein